MSKLFTITVGESVDFTRLTTSDVGGVIVAIPNFNDAESVATLLDAAKVAKVVAGIEYRSSWFHTSVGGRTLDTATKAMEAELVSLGAYLDKLQGKISGPISIRMDLGVFNRCALKPYMLADLVNKQANIIFSKFGYTPIIHCTATWAYNRFAEYEVKPALWLDHINNSNGESFPTDKYGRFLTANKSRLWAWTYTRKFAAANYGFESKYVVGTNVYSGYSLPSFAPITSAESNIIVFDNLEISPETIAQEPGIDNVAVLGDSDANAVESTIESTNNVDTATDVIDVEYVDAETTSTDTQIADIDIVAGHKMELKDVELFTTSATFKATRTISGTYYLYDGRNFKGRYRIVDSLDKVGKKPYTDVIEGWIKKSDLC